MTLTVCPCQSGEEPWPLYDARGIFCTYVCDHCEEEKRSRFRPEIFTDPDYHTDEPIEPQE